MAPPTKAQQEAEARAREVSGANPTDSAAALDVIDDVARADPGPAQPPRGADPPEPAARPEPYVSKRDQIINRYRAEQRESRPVEEIALQRSGLSPEMEALLDEPGAQSGEESGGKSGEESGEAAPPEPAAPAPAPRFKVKVHGEERELTEQELIAEAQKSLAAGNILEQVKSLKQEVQDRLRALETRQPGHQAAPAQPEPGAPAAGDPEPPADPADDPITKLIETIQFGDPAEARDRLQNTIAEIVQKTVAPAVEQSTQNARLRDEGARTQKVVEDFRKDHPELAADPLASAAIERLTLDLQIADLRELGVDPYQIPKPDGSPVGPADIAMAHRWYRSEGFNLKPPKVILEEARDKFLEWRGDKKSPAVPAGGDPPPARVEVVVDRSARRAAIPQTPARTGAPPAPAAPQPAPLEDRRSAAVQNMAQRRSLPRNKIGIGA